MIIGFGNFTGLLDYVGISVIGGVALVAAGYYLARDLQLWKFQQEHITI